MTTQNFSLRGYVTLLAIFLCHANRYLFMSHYLLSFYVTLLAIFLCPATCYLFMSRHSLSFYVTLLAIFLKSWSVSSSYQWNSKNNDSVLLFKALKLFPVVCHNGVARMDMGWNLKKLSHPSNFNDMPAKNGRTILCLVLPDEICLISPSKPYRSILWIG